MAIYAKIVADSISPIGERLTTFELSMHRYVLSEYNTHRKLSRNSASSRAIPIKTNIENILNDTAIPIHWARNQSGMVADEELDEDTQRLAIAEWIRARDNAIKSAERLIELGVHKQVANRLIENFTYQKIVSTATDWDNFFWLRADHSAQPEIRELAYMMLEEYNKSNPVYLEIGEWHTPYYGNGYWKFGDRTELEDALKISASCCAQVSYRKSDDSLEKAQRVFDMLHLTDDDSNVKRHSSPVEHQATPITEYMKAHYSMKVPTPITHTDNNGNWYSGNLKNWAQYRHTFENESCKIHPDVI